MSTHTPGPWKVYETHHPYKLGDRDGVHIERKIGTVEDHPQLHSPEPVVTLSSGVAATFVSISEADAHLIAAAPDLLAACREVAEALPELAADADPRSWYEVRKIQTALSTLLSAAIAKAEGRQS